MSKSEDYGKALDDLEAMHQAGKISDARYEMHKQKLITEASKTPMSIPVKILIMIGAVIVALILIRVIGFLFW